MPEFVLNRNHTLSGKGHMINFVKGKPTWVPPELAAMAAGIGAEQLDGEKIDPLGPEQSTPTNEPEGEARVEAIMAAIDLLRENNNAADFGADGRPSVAALNKVLGFDIKKKERDEIYPRYNAKKAAE